MGTVVITVSKTAASPPYPLSKTYTVADSDIDAVVAAFQNDANVNLSTPQNPVVATIGQVWLYVVQVWVNAIKAKVQANNTTPPVVPPQISMV